MYPVGQNAQRVLNVQRGHGYALANQTGTMAAALAQDAIVFALRADTTASSVTGVYIERLRLAFQAIVAFTTPITAGRRLGIYRATNPGAEVSGGTDVKATIRKKDGTAPASTVATALIATTAALTAGGLVREASPLALLDLVSVGAAGARLESTYELAATTGPQEWCLNPGEYIVISNPAAMDAAGTWQLTINELAWYESTRMSMPLQ